MNQRKVTDCDLCGEISRSNKKARQHRKIFHPKQDSRLDLEEKKVKKISIKKHN